MIETRRAVCTFCHTRCRVVVHSEDGKFIKAEEDSSDPRAAQPFPPTMACLRLRGVKDWFYDPARVNFPLKRVGQKGEGKWERIPWSQALDEIAKKLLQIKENYGAEAIGVTNGTGRAWEEYPLRFMHILGSPNRVGATTICFGPVQVISIAMLGWTVRHRIGKVIDTHDGKPTTKCILTQGINPAQSVPRLWKSMRDAKKLGTKIINIDPRRTETSEIADIWLQLRPGTDTALLMSMINVVIEEELYDKEFVTKWCYGFDKVRERAAEYPPEKVAAITWVPAEKIRECARLFATNMPALAINGMGVEHLQNGVQAIQTKFILSAITGNVDIDGGDYLSGPSKLVPMTEMELTGMLTPEQKKKQLGTDRFKLLSWPGRDLMQPYVKKAWGVECGIARGTAPGHAPTMYHAMITDKPYPVKAVITMTSNPLLTQPNAKLVYKALKSLDLYVVIDYWRTPSAELADYILPAASWLEKPYLFDLHGHDCTILGGEAALPSTIPGEYEHKTHFEIFRELGIRMGQKEFWQHETLEQECDYRLKPLGITHKEFMAQGGGHFPPDEYKKYERIGFGTPTGKVELYSTVFEKLGYDPLPYYKESHENPISTPDLAKEYPLMLITGGRFHFTFHSEQRNVDLVRKQHPDPLVQINPETARKFDIKDGDWVWIESPRGKIRMKCKYFDGIDPRVIHAEHGWWFPELPREEPWLGGVWESNVNVLTDDDPDACNEVTGSWPLKTALCKIYKTKVFS